jgi:hypothetical protein
MSEIVAGLIGVIAGGLVTGAVEVVQAHQDRSLRRRVAARLITADLDVAAKYVDRVREAEGWPDEPRPFAGAWETWKAQREPFAIAVSVNDWHDIGSAFESLSEIERTARPGKPLNAHDEAMLAETADRLSDALQLAIQRSAPRREHRRMLRTANSRDAQAAAHESADS